MNNTPKKVLINTLKAAFGLFIFSFGVYLTIQANIGVAPWDTLAIGISKKLNILYGTANIMVSVMILILDIILKEKIGIGMLLDAFLVGKFVDFFNYLGVVKSSETVFLGVVMIIVGEFVMGFSQYLYMKTGLGCGPRDTFFVGLKRHIPSIPIGIVNLFILVTVTIFGWLLGGPLGIGTVLAALIAGPIMQLCFEIVHFDATKVRHQNLLESFKVLVGRKARD